MTLSSATSKAPSGGSTVAIYGLMQIVVNDHGCGADPATRSRSSFLSFPPVIWIVYDVQSRKFAVGVSFRVLSLFDQLPPALTPPLTVHVTVGVFIGSLKFTQIGAPRGMFVCPLAGFVFVIFGGVGGHVQVTWRSASLGVTRPIPVLSFARTRKYSWLLFDGSIWEPAVV